MSSTSSPIFSLPDKPFALDDRSLASQLELLRQYCSLMPFDDAHDWDDVLFAQAATPQDLAQRMMRQSPSADGGVLPHQALLLAFFTMLETPRELFNTFAPRHREMYYRELLGLTERPMVPDQLALSFTLDEQVAELRLPAGLLFDAGQDADGAQKKYRLEQSLLANRARLSRVWWRQSGNGLAVDAVIVDQAGSLAWPEQGVGLFSVPAASASRMAAPGAQVADQPVPISSTGPERSRAQTRQLFLGIDGIAPGQDISLYWRVRSSQKHRLVWHYLAADSTWAALDAEVRDGTGGLFHSGVWSAVLPRDASAQGVGQDVAAGCYWLRADVSIEGTLPDAAAPDFAWIEAIKTNTAMARRMPSDTVANPTVHDAVFVPLPAATIASTLDRVDGLAEVIQTWPSEDGQAAESTPDFMQRVARQLAHRGRALSWRDIDTLLLARYPEIRAILLPSPQRLPGMEAEEFSVVVLPAHGRHDNADDLRPAFSAARLAAMTGYLLSIASPWLKPVLRLVNPVYRDVELRYQVQFKPGVNRDYGERQLALALTRHYLSWGAADRPLMPGKGLDYYGMVAFIQEQDGVQRLQSLTLDGKRESIAPANDVLLLRCAPVSPSGR